MSAGGSQQLRIYRRSRRDGMPLEQAAAHAGIPVAEARLHDAEDAKSPPPAEAYELLSEPATTTEEESAMSDVDDGNGHNSEAAQFLRVQIERWERLEEEKKGISDDQKDIMAEMKGRGYDTQIVRKVIAIRKLEPGKYEQQQMELETYLAQLGMI